MTGRVDRCKHGTNEIGEPSVSQSGTWFRLDIYTPDAWGCVPLTERRFAAGRGDYSPMFLEGINGRYDAGCSCCYLGFSHTLAAHQLKVSQPIG